MDAKSKKKQKTAKKRNKKHKIWHCSCLLGVGGVGGGWSDRALGVWGGGGGGGRGAVVSNQYRQIKDNVR